MYEKQSQSKHVVSQELFLHNLTESEKEAFLDVSMENKFFI